MVTSSYPLFTGDGTAPFIEEIARALAAREHHIDVVLPAHPKLSRRDEPRLRFFPFPYTPLRALSVWGYAQSMNADRGFKGRTLLVAPFAALATVRAVRRRLKASSYDLVHAHWVVPGAALAHRAARSARKPFVISVHGSDVFSAERNAAVGWAARQAFSAAHAVTVCSSDLKDRTLHLGARPDRTRTVPYGVDAEFFRGEVSWNEERRQAMRHRLGAAATQTLVVGVGRLVEKKGFSSLIEAAGGDPALHVAIVGDGDLRSDLQNTGLSQRTSLTLAGRFSRTEIRDALLSADIVAVPSVVDSKGNVDGLPNVLLEAMAAGRPIVASRVAGIPDVIDDGVEGVLVPPKSPRALRDALVALAGDPARRAQLGRAASLRASTDLTWERVAMTLEDAYVQAQALAER